MIIDDDEVDRIALKRRLRAMAPKAAITEAASPLDGLKELENPSIECVMIDYDMPFCNGVSLVNSIRHTPATRHLPVIMITGTDEVAVAVEAIQQGADEFLSKADVNETTLGWAIHSALNRSELRREAASREAALRSFAFHAAHDLKSPLNGIVGLANVLQHTMDSLPAEARPFLAKIEEQGRHMASLIDNLLAFADTEQSPAEFEPVDLTAAAQQAASLLDADIREAGAHVTISDLPKTRGHAAQLERVFTNLIQNAIKYRTDAAPQIAISAEALGDQVRVDVRDNGIGVPDHLRERIFNPLDRGDADDDAGHGLGLSIVKRIIETHGGRIWCQPAPEGGSVFSFTLILLREA
nr:hybrid sensor histidine kinase/response regulator [Maricaulis parjimensis]